MTFPIENLVFFDFETKCAVDLKKHGTYRYADAADPILLTYAIGDRPVRVVQKSGHALTWVDFPGELHDAFHNPETKFVAWNSEFDRAIWNYAVLNSCFLEPSRTLDAMAQGMASNLPGAPRSRLQRHRRAGKAARRQAADRHVLRQPTPATRRSGRPNGIASSATRCATLMSCAMSGRRRDR